MRILTAALLCWGLMPGFVIAAEPLNDCGTVLHEQAYDTEKSVIRSQLVFRKQDDICNREYENTGQAEKAAVAAGFDIASVLGFSGAEEKQKNSWSVRNSDFCRATKTDLESAFGSDYERKISSIAVGAWLECVRSSKENQLFISYSVSPEKNLFTGNFHTTVNTGVLERTITGITVGDSPEESIRCSIDGVWYKPSDVRSHPVKVKSTDTSVLCQKTNREAKAIIGFSTSQGSLGFITLPAPEASRISDIESLRKDFEILRQSVVHACRLCASAVQADGACGMQNGVNPEKLDDSHCSAWVTGSGKGPFAAPHIEVQRRPADNGPCSISMMLECK